MLRNLTAAVSAALLLYQLLAAQPAAAQSDDVSRRLQRLENVIREQEKALTRQRQVIVEQEKRLKQLEGKQRIVGLTLKDGETPRKVIILPGGRELSWAELEKVRGGVQGTHARLVFPDGGSVTVSKRRLNRLLAQLQPKEPVLPPEAPAEKKPVKKKVMPVRRAAPRRTTTAPPRRVVRQTRTTPTPTTAPTNTVVPTKTRAAPKDDDPTGAATRATGDKPTDQLLLERGAVLLPRGRWQIEPSIDYSRFSGDRIAINGLSLFNAIVIGTIRVDNLDRDVLTAQLRGRYGITNRIQADISIPFVYRRDRELLGVATNNAFEYTVTGKGLGDIEAGITYQPIIERGWIPGTLIRVFGRFPTGEDPFDIPTRFVGPQMTEERLVRAPTGSGFYGVGATVTFVYTSDPVAFFFGGGYTANLPNTFERTGRINPGDSYNFFAGMNVALNERASLNISFINEKVMSSSVDGIKVPGSSYNDARLIVGASLALNRRISMIFNAGIGLTEQAPDFSFVISVPITFYTPLTLGSLFRSKGK